jgi:hypothetical protein
LGTPKNNYRSLILQCGSCIKGVVVLCKTSEVVTRELICVIFLILCVVNLRDGVGNIGLCNLSRLRDLCWKCNLGFGFLWKLDVVLGSYGLNILRRTRKAIGLKREKEIRMI